MRDEPPGFMPGSGGGGGVGLDLDPGFDGGLGGGLGPGIGGDGGAAVRREPLTDIRQKARNARISGELGAETGAEHVDITRDGLVLDVPDEEREEAERIASRHGLRLAGADKRRGPAGCSRCRFEKGVIGGGLL